MPPTTRRFTSLPAQVADALRQGIAQGAWKEWLPGERALTETYQVSRKTLRKALQQLQAEGVVKAEHGIGNRIVTPDSGKTRTGGGTEQVVALLTPDPIEQMRPHTLLWINRLKSMLIENGARLHALDGRKFFSRQPANALGKVVGQQSISCWLLANSTEATQRWFCENMVPCVVAGSCHPGIDLPFVDLDHYALCRHAAGVLLAAGHNRVALLNERSGRAGDMESEAGFVAGVRESRRASAVPLVMYHDHSAASLSRVVTHLLGMPNPPTALLVSNSASYLTVISVLAQRGLRVPGDISVVSRDDEPFLSFLVPTPARYIADPNAFAKKILKPLKQVLHGENISPRGTRIIPTYMKGGSLGVVAQ